MSVVYVLTWCAHQWWVWGSLYILVALLVTCCASYRAGKNGGCLFVRHECGFDCMHPPLVICVILWPCTLVGCVLYLFVARPVLRLGQLFYQAGEWSAQEPLHAMPVVPVREVLK